jgi:hypothetical protein
MRPARFHQDIDLLIVLPFPAGCRRRLRAGIGNSLKLYLKFDRPFSNPFHACGDK